VSVIERSAPPANDEVAAAPRPPSRRPDAFAILGWPLTIVLSVLIVYPLGSTFVEAFTDSGGIDLTALRWVLDDPAFARAARNTGILLVTAGPLALAVGSLFAWLNERTDARMGAVSRLAPLVPLLIPPVALSVGWVLLGQPVAGFLNGYARQFLGLFGVEMTQGPFNIGTWPGLVFVYTIALVPYAYLVVSPALRNMDTSLEEASRMSGGGVLRTGLQISLPAILPALGSAALLIVIMGTSLFSLPRTIGSLARVDTISVYLVRLTQESPSRLNESVAVAAMLLVFVLILYFGQLWLARRGRHMTIGGKASTASMIRLGPWRWVARAAMLGYLLCVSVLPFLALVVVALQPFWQAKIDPSLFTLDNFREFFADDGGRAREGLWNSIRLAAIGATLAVGMAAIMVTYAKERRGVRSSVINGVTKVPAAISHLVIGVSLLVALAGPPFGLGGTLTILLIGYLICYIPQATIASEVARGQVGGDLLEASAMHGASKGRTFSRILLPLMRPGLAYGWAMIFVLIMGDLTASAILSGPGNFVVGSIFLEIWESGVFAELATLGTLVCLTSLVVVGLVISVRRRGASSGSATQTSGKAPATL
jgi:iron(III) transport system permease protein